MDILVLGDSFTASCESWANYLSDFHDAKTKEPNIKVKNLAQGCNSNHSITRRLIEELTEYKSSYDYVIIQWTIDFRGSYNPTIFKEPFSDRIDHGVASYENSDTFKRHEFLTEPSLNLRWLEHILLAQYFLQMYKLNYKMFFGWDVQFSKSWELFPKIYEKIDFSKWWGQPYNIENFLPQNNRAPSEWNETPRWELIEKNMWYDWGLAEWIRCNVKNGMQKDSHPTNYAHQRFGKEVVKTWIK